MKLCSHSEDTLPSRMIAAARPWIMEVPVSPDDPGALPAFIREIAFLTLSVVIGMGGPSTGGSSHRWSGP